MRGAVVRGARVTGVAVTGAGDDAHGAHEPQDPYAARSREAAPAEERPDGGAEWPPGSGPAFGTRPPPPSRSHATMVLVLGLLGLVLSLIVFPVGLALDVAAVVLGVRELRRAGREGRPTPGAALVGLLAGVVGAVLALIVTAVVAVFYPQVRDYADCMSGANTVADQQQCRSEFERGVQRRFGGQFRIGPGPTGRPG